MRRQTAGSSASSRRSLGQLQRNRGDARKTPRAAREEPEGKETTGEETVPAAAAAAQTGAAAVPTERAREEKKRAAAREATERDRDREAE